MVKIKPDYFFEDKFSGTVCGMDEVGRGPLAGPVVAAAVILKRHDIPQDIQDQINDSKLLTRQKREFLYRQIHSFAYVSIAQCTVKEIDDINILQASLRAMRKAFAALPVRPDAALVDGNRAPKLPCKTLTIINGDGKSLSIAAASIVAKHHRDELMAAHAQKFPHYGWDSNAGYGTPEHLKAIEIHGVTPLHRRSFSPVSNYLLKVSSANS
jgi:ribonuclease HII